jgi:hypothetical protein
VSLTGNQKGEGQNSLAGERVGGANSDDWRESLALCLLCEYELAVGVDICETAIKFSLKRNSFRFEDKKFCFSWIGSFKKEKTTFTQNITNKKKCPRAPNRSHPSPPISVLYNVQ